jgi:hypothetical protein
MLSYLRLKSGSWIVKGILAAMAIGLTFFFGFSSFRNAADRAGSAVATVNGETITALQFENSVRNQHEIYSKIYGGEVPEFVEKSLRQNVLDQLVDAHLLSQWATKNKVPVARREIAEKILSNAEFTQGDPERKTFNPQFYKERFRPWFKNTYGIDYEEALKEDLRSEKTVQFLFRDMLVAKDEAAALDRDLARTLYHFKQVVIDPKTLQGDAQTGEKEAAALADEVRSAFADEAKVIALLKPFNISVKDLGEKKASDWRTILPPQSELPAASDILDALLALNADKPLPDRVFQVGDLFYVYKWVGSRADDKAPVAEGNLAFASLLRQSFTDSLHQQATIEFSVEE